MGLILFIISYRIRAIFSYQTQVDFIKNILLIITGVANGIIVGLAINFLFSQEKIVIEDAINAINLVVVISAHIFTFIPSYTKKTSIIHRAYPSSTVLVVIANLMYDILSLPSIFAIVFLVGFYGVLSKLFFINFVFSLVIFLTSLISISVLKGLIEYRIKYRPHLIAGYIFSIALAIFTYNITSVKIISSLLALPILTALNFIIEKHKDSQFKSNGLGGGNASVAKYFFINRKSRVTLSLAIVIKALALIIVLRMPENISWMAKVFVISPLVCFTYLFNNIWGFFPEIWIQTQIRYNTLGSRFLLYLELLCYPILIDIIITMTALVFYKKLDFFYLYVYGTSVVLMTLIGFIISLARSVKVDKLANFLNGQRNTSILGIVLDFLVIALVWLPAISFDFTYIVVTISLLFILLAPVLLKNAYLKRYKIYSRLK